MIRRLVKMTFREDEAPVFQALFEKVKGDIRKFPGCMHLELWQQHDQANVFFTFSLWESKEALDQYRNSALFAETWKQTKALFAAAPEVWSLEFSSQA
jgi:autoinducer 2-degrading protein